MSTQATLDYTHLITLQLTVDREDTEDIGAVTPVGKRMIVPVLNGSFKGERLSGELNSPGADWIIYRPDGSIDIDVRLTLKTDDGALIYLTYQGRFLVKESGYSLVVTPKFETSHEKYRWLNDIVAVAVGKQDDKGPIYEVFEINSLC